MEQTFNSQQVFVTKNVTFLEEFALNIQHYLAEIESRIGKNLLNSHIFKKKMILYVVQFHLLIYISGEDQQIQ